MSDNNENQIPALDQEIFLKAMQVFCDKYKPAKDFAETTDLFNTQEIITAIQDTYPTSGSPQKM